MEEVLQLGPNDFGSDKGIPYLLIRHDIINGVKTLSSARKLLIHPQLIALGLLKLVALRQKAGHIRLFPFINRGKAKGTFSANFSKCFAYYRRTNKCYWPGLDFHALRTTFHHDLLQDNRSDAFRCRLMGHAYTDEGDRSYGQSLGIEALAERLRSVQIDISMIRHPFDEPVQTPRARAADLNLWAYAKQVTLDFSRPSKPTDNGFIESFNSKLRSECLNAHWFMSLADAVEKLEDWRRHYNNDRPHSAIGYNVPSALHCPGGVTSPPP